MSLLVMNVISFLSALGYSFPMMGQVDLSGFGDILFLFIGLGGIALAIGVALIVIIVVLDIVGVDVLGLAKTVFRGGK